MHMSKERLQILIEPEQRRALQEASERTGMSVSMLIRDALDEYLRETNVLARRMAREAAVDWFAARRAPVPEPDELRRMIDDRTGW
jgi:hypothetical protein